ncbi:membrane protein insertase YidC [Candidatus Parcubacteria bacterium]|nr:membrane protein insertase YidC [Candidatus Parcubacteria bacterium]
MFETLFYQPILNLLVFIYNIIPGQDMGITIIVLTIIIKIILFPISRKAIESQKALQELQPKIEKIKKEYKDKKEQMGIAMMKLYKDNKVNPLSSCMPLLIQLPFLFAVFRVFRDGLTDQTLTLLYSFVDKPEVINHTFLGLLDLSQTRVWVLALAAGLAQFYQVRMMSTKKPEIKTPGSKDEDMTAIMNKQMQYFMPIMTVWFSLMFSGGLALYWLVTTLLTILQQILIFNKDKKKDEIIEGEVIK